MFVLKAIKTFFKVGSSSLAVYVGLSRSQMESISSRRRGWSLTPYTHAMRLQKALCLEKPLDELPFVKSYLKDETEKMRTLLQKQIKRLEFETDDTVHEIKTTETERAQCLRGLHACTQLLSSTTDSEKRKWLERRHRILSSHLVDCDIGKLILLRSRLSSLRAQLKYLKSIPDQSL